MVLMVQSQVKAAKGEPAWAEWLEIATKFAPGTKASLMLAYPRTSIFLRALAQCIKGKKPKNRLS